MFLVNKGKIIYAKTHKKMVIVKLMGGLGNQMFQYAAARALSGNEKIYLDTSFLKNNTISNENFTARAFELNVFQNLLQKSINNNLLRFLLSKKKKYTYLRKVLPSKFRNIKFVYDDNFGDFLSKSNANSSLYLDGYFQNPTYFDGIRPALLNEFRFIETTENISHIKNNILTSNAISLHIRRGDYLKANVNSVHGILPLSYYEQAVSYLNEKLKNPIYFIFSDDPDWCTENLSFLKNKYIVSGNYPSWIDMHLMSICKHHIIANSSFSWWGAWLNENKEKLVVCPKTWFVSQSTNIIPNEWIVL